VHALHAYKSNTLLKTFAPLAKGAPAPLSGRLLSECRDADGPRTRQNKVKEVASFLVDLSLVASIESSDPPCIIRLVKTYGTAAKEVGMSDTALKIDLRSVACPFRVVAIG